MKNVLNLLLELVFLVLSTQQIQDTNTHIHTQSQTHQEILHMRHLVEILTQNTYLCKDNTTKKST